MTVLETDEDSARRRAKMGLFNGWRRLLRLRLVIPMLRASHEPEHTARGVSVGLFFAMTPTVGVQMPLVMLAWLALRLLRRSWDFNPVIAMAWTWVTNVITVPPIYYAFLVTGELMLGRWGESGGYEVFQARLAALLQTDASFLDSLWIYAVGMFDAWGLPMFVGSIPWAIGSAWLGYVWSLKATRRFRARKAARMQMRAAETVD